jgi:hypothetical protein
LPGATSNVPGHATTSGKPTVNHEGHDLRPGPKAQQAARADTTAPGQSLTLSPANGNLNQ